MAGNTEGQLRSGNFNRTNQGNGNIPGTNVNTPGADVPTTTIKYDEITYDFGMADEGTVVKHIFRFTNTGSEPLIISNAKGSCGCTVPTWPKQPVPPGGKGEIAVEFNTKGKPGRQSKQVTVTANTTPTDSHIEITGEVRGKEQPVSKGKNNSVPRLLSCRKNAEQVLPGGYLLRVFLCGPGGDRTHI
ncbi:MAG: DUF1573 domain-containing protein [Saprospirales bacterium]|nr:DUF1573 domain-containing protein [Saprospirales bacterium]